jgi:hypothetical protein
MQKYQYRGGTPKCHAHGLMSLIPHPHEYLAPHQIGHYVITSLRNIHACAHELDTLSHALLLKDAELYRLQ